MSLLAEVRGVQCKVDEIFQSVEDCVIQVESHVNVSNVAGAVESLECIHQMVANRTSDVHQRLARLRRISCVIC